MGVWNSQPVAFLETFLYLNSPETPVFHKSQELYGLYEARRAYNDLHSVILVEGYMDVLVMSQNGFKNVQYL